MMDNSIGIYVHIPFCKSKCNYCDFNSYSGREHLAGPYFDALFSEMKLRSVEIGDRPVKTIFIGGGTPSLVDPKQISAVLELCSKLFTLDPQAEISMESNPGTLTYDSLKDYRAAGVNRLSIELQAWQDRLLKELGRIHDRRQFADNFEAAVKAGFCNINVDLIFGLPGQTMEEWVETLQEVTALGKELTHLSCYSLKIEEGTNFGDRYEARTLLPADDELDRRMYKYTIDYLAQKGYEQYEISNFARQGFECRHNFIYWKALEYAGFGAGAHSYLDSQRFGSVAGIEKYIEAIAGIEQRNREKCGKDNQGLPKQCIGLHEDIQLISRQESMSEYMILGLRLTDGITAAEFEDRFGESLYDVYGDKLVKLVNQDLLSVFNDRFKLTPLGLDLANQVFVEFI